MTIQPPWVKRQINFVLIGGTGVGKTAMLELLANIWAGVQPVGFKATHQGLHPAVRPTFLNSAPFPAPMGTRLISSILPDSLTPEGLTWLDSEHKAAIVNAIKKHFETIDAVIILANGTLARLGAATGRALTTISGMFPKSIVNNIAFIFTMVPDPIMFNFDQASLPVELKAKICSIIICLLSGSSTRKGLLRDSCEGFKDVR
ncbi:hypothetical protein DFH05DRAFT_1525555 [Lentinula detonsa]|uniref:G domain-containing protein n=2 Tax=Lentinula TaxID=5352 RepID=A0AA38NBL9_9AGAR|nr:hypothetical protein DFH05DRAFT_1525555 [Lentinula detonsa]KAJ3781561.1 hypothetical protein GGU10DRAFT_411408 [Lentinula aff. detonsa]